MNNKISLKTISPKDLWDVFRSCVIYLLIACVVVTAATYIRAWFTYSPMYSSTATMFLIPDKSDPVDGMDPDTQAAKDHAIALRVMSDCDYLLKSRKVLDKVGEQVGISNGYAVIRPRLTINNPEDTRVFEVTVTWNDNVKAKAIVDAICSVGIQEITNRLDYEAIQVLDEGTLNPAVVNTVSVISYLKFGIIAALAVYIIFLLMFLFDNYIHDEADIERYLGVAIIGDIPDADAPKKKSKYQYGKYKSYRYYKRHGGTGRYQDGYVKYSAIDKTRGDDRKED